MQTSVRMCIYHVIFLHYYSIDKLISFLIYRNSGSMFAWSSHRCTRYASIPLVEVRLSLVERENMECGTIDDTVYRKKFELVDKIRNEIGDLTKID